MKPITIKTYLNEKELAGNNASCISIMIEPIFLAGASLIAFFDIVGASVVDRPL